MQPPYAWKERFPDLVTLVVSTTALSISRFEMKTVEDPKFLAAVPEGQV